MRHTTFARGYSSDHFGAISDGLLTVERSLGTGKSLTNYFCRSIDQNRHEASPEFDFFAFLRLLFG